MDFSFLLNGPLVDKIGGKKGILIAAIGSSVAKHPAGRADVSDRDGKTEDEHGRRLFDLVWAEHVFSKLRRGFHHQGQGPTGSMSVNAGCSAPSSARLISIGIYFRV